MIRDPQKALDDGVLPTPLLMKLSPSPTRELIGNLNQLQLALDLTP